jgi:hypothetical protein
MTRRIAVLAGILLIGLVPAAPASAAGVAWTVRSVAEPSNFSADDAQTCAALPECNVYALLVTNASDQPSSETDPLILTDTLPKGLKPLHPSFLSGHDAAGQKWACLESERSSEVWTEKCEYLGLVLPGAYAPSLTIRVTPPSASMAGALLNEVAVTGGGSSRLASTTEETPISDAPPPFGPSDFAFESLSTDGLPEDQAGAHLWEATTSFTTPLTFAPSGSEDAFQTVENIRDTGLELPAGFIGDPQATPRCTLVEFANASCPAASEVGAFAVATGAFAGEFQFTGAAGLVAPQGCCSAVYNIVPEAGYPAEFAFEFGQQAVLLYAGVIHSSAGYRLRVISPGIPATLETSTAAITFFGNPSSVDKSGGGSPFLSNPSDCSAGALKSKIEQDSWEHPERFVGAETTAYPQLTGCSALQFHPSLTLGPDIASADVPAGLNVDLQVPQTSGFEELATPPLKTATVHLPEGLVVNPSAASGLEGCEPTGPKGINIGSESIGAKGQDLGDPEATELGEGHAGPGGNDSPYDDGFWHAAPGHCPAASTMGTVEATTPLLPEPIKGQIFLGTPECAPCTSADAEGGRLLRLYLEINDPKTGTILKLPGTVAADASTGRLTASFKENPQLPFEDLKLKFFSGPRAALTSPSTCGTYSTSSSLEPWSAPETPTAVSNSSFDITSGPQGCGPPPNKPHFEAGTTSTQAGAYSPFVLKLSREDGTQRLKALNVTLPAGLTGKLAGVQECSAAAITAGEGMGGKAEQASPSCPLASELGTVNVGAGSGPDPFYVQGHAYLAGPYKGAPLSMAIITPAVAGPFDLGTVVVRAALYVDPYSAQITVKSDPIPQIRAGIPLDVRSIAVNISRNQFTLNPTNCSPMTLAASVVADASTAAVSNPFQVGNCSSLGFKPKLAISLKGGTKRNQHPALKAVVTYPQGGAYANIAAAQVSLPHSEFLDQGNLDNVCKQAQLLSATCPKSSIYGHAKAWSPLLEKPLEGPVYLAVGFGYKLPALVADLNGQIRILLKGKVDTDKQEGIRNTFETVPDAPVSRFVLSMKGGKKYGLLVNSENICSKPQKATAAFTAQNGKALTLKPLISNSCGKKSAKAKKGKHSKHAPSRLGTSHR